MKNYFKRGNRTNKRVLGLVLCILLVLSFSLTGCGGQADPPAPPPPDPNGDTDPVDQDPTDPVGEGEPQFGGTLKIAMDGEPATLDMMMTTATVTWTLSWHMFENLFALDEKQDIIPMLAEDVELSEDYREYRITLRQGVKFHNGKEMKAEDVIASLNRWGAVNNTGRGVYENLESIEAVNDYEILVKLSEVDATFMVALAAPNNGAIIIPSEIAEAAGDTHMLEFIGTGPFKFVEWRQNAHIMLERFEDYAALEGEARGYGGNKTAYVDRIQYVPVPDATVQVAAVESGEYHYAYAASSDDYDRLKTLPGVRTVVSEPRAHLAFILNTESGPMSDLKTRQAFQAALKMDDISLVSRGDEAIWRLNPSLMQKETIWYSEVGAEYYDQNDTEKAKQLLEESSYNGETIRWIASWEGYYNAALVAKPQLEAAGFVIDVQRYEVGTESSMRQDPSQWDAAVTGYTNRPDPTLVPYLNSSSPGWWDNPEKEELLENMIRETDFDKRFEMWERIQELYYEDAAYIKICDYSTLRVMSDKLMNFQPSTDIFFWNVWLDE